MTKQEYNKITELLNKKKEYNDLIVGMIQTGDCRISGIYSDGTRGYLCVLDKKDQDELQVYFTRRLDDISKELKELGYYD